MWVVPVSGHVCVAIDAGGIETVCVAAVDMSGYVCVPITKEDGVVVCMAIALV